MTIDTVPIDRRRRIGDIEIEKFPDWSGIWWRVYDPAGGTKCQEVVSDAVGEALWLAAGALVQPLSQPSPVEHDPAPAAEGDLREALAAYAHEAWGGWMRYLFNPERGTPHGNGEWTIHAESVERWRRQCHTAYADLPVEEKHSDRDEADKMLALMQPTSLPSEAPAAESWQCDGCIQKCNAETHADTIGIPHGCLWECDHPTIVPDWHRAEPTRLPEPAEEPVAEKRCYCCEKAWSLCDCAHGPQDKPDEEPVVEEPPCPTCKGFCGGYVVCKSPPEPTDPYRPTERCPACAGGGQTGPEQRCSRCNGRGSLPTVEPVADLEEGEVVSGYGKASLSFPRHRDAWTEIARLQGEVAQHVQHNARRNLRFVELEKKLRIQVRKTIEERQRREQAEARLKCDAS